MRKNNSISLAKNILIGSMSSFLLLNAENKLYAYSEKLNSKSIQTAQFQIEGQVTNDKGEAMAGVSIFIKGNPHKGTLSDSNGHFSLTISPNEILVFKHLGYQTKEVSVGNNSSLNIVLLLETEQLSEVTVTSTGTKRNIKDFTGTVNVVSASQIKELAIPSVGDAVRFIPGANYQDEDGRGLRPSIGLRGLDPSRSTSTLVLVDGKIPIGQSYTDMATYYMMPVGAIESVEVIKGASPVLYGSGSIGGVLNIITKKGGQTPKSSVNLQYGNGNAINIGAETSGSVSDMTYYAGYHRKQGDGLRTSRSKFAVNDLTLNLEGNFGEKHQWKIFLNAFTEDSDTPGGLNQKQWEENPKQSVNPYDFFEARRFSGTFSYKRIFDENNSLTSAVYGSYLERDWWLDNRHSDPAKRKFTAALRNIPSIGIFSDYERLNDLWGHKNKLLAGIRLHGDITNMISVAGDEFGVKSGKETSSSVNAISVMEGYIFDEFFLNDQFSISPALRYTHADYGVKNYTAGSWRSATEKALTYSFGAFYKFSEQYRIYATYSKGYQMPRFRDAMEASEDLNAESSNNYEIGFRTQPAEWIDLDLSAYILDFDNKIVRESGLLKNGVKSLHQGIEGSGNIYLSKNIKLYGNASIQKATFSTGTYKGNRLPYAPKYMASAGIRHQIEIGTGVLSTNVYGNFVSTQFSDVANTEAGSANGNIGAIPRYYLLNATINYRIGNWNFNANGLNLLNRTYFTSRHSSWGGIMPASTINVAVGASYSF
ncbi:TonB-dependent siderophore receptor [Capnocytophaga canis]|uniref:TonB-dependent siderophore receptor n=1 Tax=Capnocytophaga canis TaxID=1848903 RepID=A0A0B7IT30_9FLAO|nr:TonB-dependent receptor [Capnocytophaga canis]CEN44079.1 TonB-dependent siderophore receptor [Capnocytophaga canis]CEN44457.1 TonB-dependent siderophore receptor [Capnocytophaga canis]CEN53118.1 TonB-dependent siderophore receptor [Capnocytophaga canis]